MHSILRLGFCILLVGFLVCCVNNRQHEQQPATQTTQEHNQPEGQAYEVTPPEAGSGHIPSQNPGTNSAARMINPAMP